MRHESAPLDLITSLRLQPHPEGGHYRRTFTAAEILQTPRGERPAMTSILYLLQPGERSRWHRIRSLERWLHHQGGVLELAVLDEVRGPHVLRLGPAGQGESPIQDIPPMTWFAARPLTPDAPVLVSCVVCPGFDFADFEMADPEQLQRDWPEAVDLIQRFCR